MNIDYDSKDIALTIYAFIAFVLWVALVFSVIIFFIYILFTYIGT